MECHTARSWNGIEASNKMKRIKKKNLTMLARKIPLRKKLKVIEWNLRNHDLYGPFPLFVQIETDARCNLNCIMCVRNRLTSNKRMKLDQFKEVLDKMGSGLTHVIPYGQGEALMNPEFIQLMEYVREKGMLWSLVTNGMRMQDKYHNVRRLMELQPTYVAFSIDVPDKKLYEEIRPGADMDIVRENFKNLVAIRDELWGDASRREKPMIDLTTPLRMDTKQYIQGMMELKEDWGADRIRFRNMVWAYDEGPSVATNAISQMMTRKEIEALMEPYKDRTDIIWWLQNPTKRVCTWPKDSIYIDSNGDLMVCACGAEDFEILGNIFEMKNIFDLWNTPKWDRIRQETIDGTHGKGFCSKCDSWHSDWKGI